MSPKPHNIVKYWREQRGLSQAQLGDASGIIQQEIAKIELGKRRLTDDLMKKLAPPLGIHPCDLMSDAAPGDRAQEQELLASFRTLADHDRSQALRVLRAMGDGTPRSPEPASGSKPGEMPRLRRGLHEDA